MNIITFCVIITDKTLNLYQLFVLYDTWCVRTKVRTQGECGRMKYRCIPFVTKYLKSAIFSEDLLVIFCCNFVLNSENDTYTYAQFICSVSYINILTSG